MSETKLVNQIVAELHERGVPCFRLNAGLIIHGKGASRRVTRGAPAGTPDIIGWSPYSGRVFFLEVKLLGKKLSKKQVEWHQHAKACDLLVATVVSVDEALTITFNWCVDDPDNGPVIKRWLGAATKEKTSLGRCAPKGRRA